MSGFAIRTPYLIIVACLMIFVLGVSSVARMPVDMFPSMNVPVVVVATFYAGMPPEQIEGDITYHLERFFTLASGIDHMESRSLDGVSIIRVYFQPDTNADTDAATIPIMPSTKEGNEHASEDKQVAPVSRIGFRLRCSDRLDYAESATHAETRPAA